MSPALSGRPAPTLLPRDRPDDAEPAFYARLLAETGGRQPQDAATTDRLGPLEPQPWPLLERALDYFDRDEYRYVPQLRAAAQFNCANVRVRLDTEAHLQAALEILDDLLSEHRREREVGRFDWISSLVGPETQKRQKDEANAFGLSVVILKSLATAMHAIHESGTGALPTIAASLAELENCRDKARHLIVASEAQHDVLADALTKQGIINYFFAVAAQPWNDALFNEAAASLKAALQYKVNWIPAQTYLAQVYQALGRTADAAEQLSSLLGKRVSLQNGRTEVAAPAP